MIKAVLLDFDDTLYLSQKPLFEIQNKALRRMGRADMDFEVHTKTLGRILNDSMQVRSPGIDFDTFKKHYDEIICEYAATGKLDLVPQENLDVLEKLKAEGYILAIVTSRSENEIKHLLDEKHALSFHIKDIYHKENTGHHKPDPRVFEAFFKKEGLKPSECIYVGDSIGDAAATVSAGMQFIASLENGLKTPKDFEEYEVSRFINKFTELPEAVCSLNQGDTNK